MPLVILAIGILVLFFLIVKVKLNSFLALLLVAGAEKSRLDEVDKCEKDLAEQSNVLGVVLNSCRYMSEEFGY